MSTRLKTWIKRGAKTLGALLILVILAVAGALLYLETAPGKRFLKSKILAAAADALDGSVEIGRIEGNLLGGVELSEVVVRDARGNIAALIPTASADYSLTQFVRGELKIDAVRVEKPLIIGRVYPDGVLNLTQIAKPGTDEPTEPLSLHISLQRAEIVGATLLYDAPKNTAPKADAPKAPSTASQSELKKEASDWFDTLNKNSGAQKPPPFSGLLERAASLPERLKHPPAKGASLTKVAVTDLGITASFHMYPNSRMSGKIIALDGTFLSDASDGAQPLELRNTRFLKTATRLEASLERLMIGEMAKLENLAAGVDFQTEPDALGNPVIVAPGNFIAEIGDLQVKDPLVRIVAPDAPVIGALQASLAVGGKLDKMNFFAQTSCANGQKNSALTLGGSLAFPENIAADLGYDVAILLNDFNAMNCIKIDAARTDLSGALSASGRGIDPERLKARATISLDQSAVGDYKIDTLYLSAGAEDADYKLEPLLAITPYGRVKASGHFDLNGDYQFQLDADANPRVRELLQRAGDTAMETQFARINLTSEGKLDLNAPSPVGRVARAELQANWQIEGGHVENYNIRSSRGEVDISVKPGPKTGDGSESRAVAFGADLDAHGLDTPQLRAQYIGAKASGDATLALPVDDILAALKRLSSTWQIQVRNLRAGANKIQSADISAQASRSGSNAPFGWKLGGSVNGTQLDQNRVKSAQFDLNGRVALTQQSSATGSSIALGQIAAAGKVNIQKLAAGDTTLHSADIELDVQGRPPNLSGRVGVNAQDLHAGGEEIPNLDANISLSPGREFEVHANATRVLPEPNALSGNDLNDGEANPPRRTQKLTINAQGAASRDFQKFDFDQLELASPEMSFSAPTGASVDLGNSGVRLSGMRLESGETAISAEGQFRTSGAEDFHVELTKVKIGEIRENFDLQSLIPPLQGEVNGTLDLEGTAREPVLTIDLSIRDLYYDGYGPIDIDLKAHYQQRRLTIETFDVRAYDTPILSASGNMPLDLNLSGTVQVPLDKPVDMKLQIPTMQVERFYEALPLLEDNNMKGEVMADIGLQGTVESPIIKLNVELNDAAFSGEVGAESVEIDQITTHLRGSYKPPSVGSGGIGADYELNWRGRQIVGAHLSAPVPIARWVRQTLDDTAPAVNFTQALDDVPLKLALKIAGLNLDDVPIESFAEADASGSIYVDLNASGTFSEPRADFEIRMENFGWEQYRDINILGDMSLRNQVLRIEQFGVDWTDQQILSAEGKIPLPTDMLFSKESLADLPVEFKAQLHEFALKRLSVIDYEFAKYKGVIAAFFKIDGTLSNPNFHGRAGLFNTLLAGGRTGSLAVEFQGADNQIQVDGSVCRDYASILNLRAELPIITDILELASGTSPLAEGELRGKITSEKIRLSELFPEELVSDYIADPKGTLAMDLSLSGGWEQPKVLGSVNINKGAVTLAYFGRRFTDINLDVTATDNQVLLRELSVHEDDSYMKAKGDMQFSGVKPTAVKAQFESKDFNIGGFVPNMTAYITSEADVKGDLSGKTRKLRANFTELNVTMPESQGGDLYPTELDGELVVLSRQDSDSQIMDVDKLLASSGEDAADRTRTEIRVTAGSGSWLHHPVVDVNFKADVTATMGGPAVQVTGSVGTIRGNAEMIGKTFEIPEQENAVRFTGDSPPDPSLDIRALHILDREITADIGEPSDGEPRIIINVRGRATKPSLTLESDPPLSETEILYVLMTGRAPNQAGAGEESRVSSLALSAASGIFAGMLQERLSGTLPLDVVRLQPGEEGFNDLRVQIGKYVTDEIFVSYVLRLGADEGEGMNVIKLDYRFLPAWKLGFQLSNQLNGEANIFWDIY